MNNITSNMQHNIEFLKNMPEDATVRAGMDGRLYNAGVTSGVSGITSGIIGAFASRTTSYGPGDTAKIADRTVKEWVGTKGAEISKEELEQIEQSLLKYINHHLTGWKEGAGEWYEHAYLEVKKLITSKAMSERKDEGIMFFKGLSDACVNLDMEGITVILSELKGLSSEGLGAVINLMNSKDKDNLLPGFTYLKDLFIVEDSRKGLAVDQLFIKNATKEDYIDLLGSVNNAKNILNELKEDVQLDGKKREQAIRDLETLYTGRYPKQYRAALRESAQLIRDQIERWTDRYNELQGRVSIIESERNENIKQGTVDDQLLADSFGYQRQLEADMAKEDDLIKRATAWMEQFE